MHACTLRCDFRPGASAHRFTKSQSECHLASAVGSQKYYHSTVLPFYGSVFRPQLVRANDNHLSRIAIARSPNAIQQIIHL